MDGTLAFLLSIGIHLLRLKTLGQMPPSLSMRSVSTRVLCLETSDTMFLSAVKAEAHTG